MAYVFSLGLDQISLPPISCGSAMDAPLLAAWVRCRRFYHLKKSHEINPQDPQTIYGLAFAYKSLDDLKNAQKYFKDLLDMPEGLLIKMCGERDSNP